MMNGEERERVHLDDNGRGRPAPVIFNISGGNNQILPNATEAVQNFYGCCPAGVADDGGDNDSMPEDFSAEDAKLRLSAYMDGDEEHIHAFVARLHACRTAKEVGRAVVRMLNDGLCMDKERIVKKDFIQVVAALIPNVSSGRGINNLRVQINNALMEYKKARRR